MSSENRSSADDDGHPPEDDADPERSDPGLDGTLQGRDDGHDETDTEEELGDNVFDGATDRGPIEAGRPEAENALFVALGVLVGALVILRLMGVV